MKLNSIVYKEIFSPFPSRGLAGKALQSVYLFIGDSIIQSLLIQNTPSTVRPILMRGQTTGKRSQCSFVYGNDSFSNDARSKQYFNDAIALLASYRLIAAIGVPFVKGNLVFDTTMKFITYTKL